MRRIVLCCVLLGACEGGRISVDKDVGDTDVAGPNTAPTAPVVAISPSSPGGGDDLVASLVFPADDADGDTLTYVYAWVVDGAPRNDQTTSTVPASATSRGEVWQVFVRADDQHEQGPPGDASVTIGNGDPTLAPSWTTPAPNGDDALVVAANAVDPDGDPVTLSYAWSVDGVLTGYTEDTVTPDATQIGQTWTVVVTAQDDHGGTATADLSVVVHNRLPVLSNLQVTPNPAHLHTALVAAFSAEDPDGDDLETRYAWTVGGTPMPSITGPVVPGGSTHDGDTWVVTVTLDDHRGTLVSGTASTTVVNHAPTLSSVALTPAAPGDGDRLVLSYTAADVDGDTLTPTIAWYRDGVLFSTGASATVAASSTAVGQTWSATVSVSDGAVSSAPRTSNTVTVVDIPPVAPAVTFSPPVPAGCGPLQCVALGDAVDPDGTTVTVTFSWLKDGAPFTTQSSTTWTGDTILEDDLVEGATFTCRITATSGTMSTTEEASVTVPSGGLATETFTAAARASADILLIVDDSCSMFDPQDKLAADIGVVLDELARGSVDYHLGVTTTDWVQVYPGDPTPPPPETQGRLVLDATSGLRWITRATPDALSTLERMIAVGINGNATERGLDAAAIAFSPNTTENAGFLRATGAIGILVLSDEDDQSLAASGTTYATALQQLRQPSDIVTYGIVGPIPDGCSGNDFAFAYEAPRYHAFLAATEGGSASICDDDYAAALETFAGELTGLPRRFTLSSPAPDGVASVVRVTSAGGRTTLSQGTDWTFDAAEGQVVLTATPTSGTHFEVIYEPGCPTEPGDTDTL